MYIFYIAAMYCTVGSHIFYHLHFNTIDYPNDESIYIRNTVNDKNLAGLKFGESANKSVWWKKVWQIHPKLQVY